MDEIIPAKLPVKPRRYSKTFKTRIIAACELPGVSVAGVTWPRLDRTSSATYATIVSYTSAITYYLIRMVTTLEKLFFRL
jgi:hypothetical protein